MELNEVMTALNPQLALPVVGVVLFVFLVFAFGVRSSVQPPSFDFFDESDRRSKKSKKTKKPAANGHIHVVSSSSEKSEDELDRKPSPSGGKASQKSPKADETVPAKKLKKAVAKPETPKEEQATGAATEAEDGEWTTQRSRKGKKLQKTKKEDAEPSSEKKSESPKQEPRASPDTKQSPKEKRSKKKKAESPAVEEPVTSPEVAPSSDSQVIEKVDVAESAPVSAEPPLGEEVHEVESSQAQVVTVDQTTDQAEITGQPVASADPSSASNSPTGATEDQLPQPVPKKSPKKKKGRPAPATPSIANQEQSRQDSNQLPSKNAIEVASEASSNTDSGAKEEKTDSGVGEETSKKEVFNEMGDDNWTEAKPQRKKKKVRRDN